MFSWTLLHDVETVPLGRNSVLQYGGEILEGRRAAATGVA
jgi:hypothetical protein